MSILNERQIMNTALLRNTFYMYVLLIHVVIHECYTKMEEDLLSDIRWF